jgi:Pirin
MILKVKWKNDVINVHNKHISMKSVMKCLQVKTASKVYPTGNPNFAVSQAFPSAFKAQVTDPFLMCDYFGPEVSTGKMQDPDAFPVAWHPHRGMDIMTYLKQGVGRHADSIWVIEGSMPHLGCSGLLLEVV